MKIKVLFNQLTAAMCFGFISESFCRINHSLLVTSYKKNSRCLDVIFFIFILIFSYHTATTSVYQNIDKISFYQKRFAPAVMYACGHGYKNISSLPVTEFLTGKSNKFDCSSINVPIEYEKLEDFQNIERYLIFSTAVLWRINGVSWEGMLPLFGILFALTIVGLYGIFRLAMGSLTSLLLIIIWFYSQDSVTHYLHNLLALRDFSKSPFILLSVFFIGLCVKFPFKRNSLITLSGGTGLLLGIGVGFRTDLLILLPFYLISLFFFNAKNLKQTVIDRVFAIAMFCIAFLISSWPILSHLEQGNLFHVTLEGYSTYFNYYLHVKNSTVYNYFYRYNDSFMISAIQAYAYNVLHLSKQMEIATSLYVKLGRLYYFDLILTFPGDLILRTFAAIYQLISSLIFPVVAISMVWLYNKRIAVYILFVTLYLTAYTVIQFHPRHYFYLSFIPYWFLGFTVFQLLKFINNSLLKFIGNQNRGLFDVVRVKNSVVSLFLLWFVVGGAAIILFFSSRGVQTTKLKYYFNKLNTHEKLKLNYTIKHVNESEVLIQPINIIFSGLTKLSNAYLNAYIMLEFNGSLCTDKQMKINYIYTFNPKVNIEKIKPGLVTYNDNSHQFIVDVKGKTRNYFPIYYINTEYQPMLKFIGFKLSKSKLKCLAGVYQLQNLSDLPFMFPINLTEDWATKKLYQQFL